MQLHRILRTANKTTYTDRKLQRKKEYWTENKYSFFR